MKRLRLKTDLTGVIVLLAVGVLLPVMLSTAVGIVALVIAKDAGGIVTGVLVISFTVTAAGGALVTVMMTGRKARLARRQADFVANVSHEFRTPLSAIRLYTQTLQSGKLSADEEQTRRCLATILRETEWLDVMIDRVLTWRASSRDMMTLVMVSEPVSRAVHDAADRFRAMASPDDMEFSVSISSQRPVRHDRRALSLVVLNLLTNAYKFTGARKVVALTVRDEGEHVLIEVKDNGIGLLPTDMKKIFRPFYRVREDGDGDSGGVGLGLAICEHLVERHEGSISAASEKGKGATFTIRLRASGGE